jgi:hypothetical protein
MTDTNIPTSEVLNRAADLIEERGWTTGDGWFGDDGHPLCVEGAIAAAMGERGGPGFRCPARAAVESYVGRAPFIWNDNLIFQLGDDGWPNWRGWLGGGTQEEARLLGRQRVIETLRAAAVISSKAKERADAPEAVTVR